MAVAGVPEAEGGRPARRRAVGKTSSAFDYVSMTCSTSASSTAKSNIFTGSTPACAARGAVGPRDCRVLSDLRFFHRFGNLTVKSSDPGYVGQRYEGFALDLSVYAATRVRTKWRSGPRTASSKSCRLVRVHARHLCAARRRGEGGHVEEDKLSPPSSCRQGRSRSTTPSRRWSTTSVTPRR